MKIYAVRLAGRLQIKRRGRKYTDIEIQVFSIFIGSVSSFTPGTDSARTGIQFNMCLTPLPYFEYLIQINCFHSQEPDNYIQIFTFLFEIIPINLPSTLVPSEVRLKWRVDYIKMIVFNLMFGSVFWQKYQEVLKCQLSGQHRSAVLAM